LVADRLWGVISPNGGERLVSGSICRILWGTAGEINDVSYVKIERTVNNGQIWVEINTVPNVGLYDWLVPGANSSLCRIRISDPNYPAVSDTSNEAFSIIDCIIPLPGDINGDCYVDFHDFQIFAANWLHCGNPLDPNCIGP
jgi:hypothetical protein